MDELISNLLSGTIGGGSSALVIIAFMKVWISKLQKEKDDLEIRLNDLEKNQITNLEKSIDKLEKKQEDHISDDQSQKIQTQLEMLIGEVHKIGNQIQRFSEATATHGAELKAHESYIKNLDNSLQNHKREKH